MKRKMEGDTDELYRMPEDKVRTLAWQMHQQEAQNIRKMKFRSAFHRDQYLRDSRNTYESAVGILDSMEEAKNKYHDDQERSKVLNYLYKFSSFTVGSACRTVWNLHLRDEYLKKIRAFAEEKLVSYNEIISDTRLGHVEKSVRLDNIIKEVAEHKQTALDYMRSRQNPSTRNFSKFWRKLRHTDNLFDNFICKYRRKLIDSREIRMSDLEQKLDGMHFVEETKPVEITGERSKPIEVVAEETKPVEITGERTKPIEVTEEVRPTEKIRLTEKIKPGDGAIPAKKSIVPDTAEVYHEVLVSSGKPTYPKLVKFAKGASRALLLFQVGMIVWDTYESRDPLKTLAKDTTLLAVSLGAGIIGEAIGTVAATTALGALGVSTSTLVGAGIVYAASFATGVGVAVLAGIAVGWLFTKLFESGKSSKKVVTHHSSTGHSTVHMDPHHPSTEHRMLYFAPVPDGERLARQLTAAASRKV